MSRTLAILALVVTMLALVVSGSVAGSLRPAEKVPGGSHRFGSTGNVSEFGISAVLTAGSEERPVEATLILTNEYGKILTPCGGVVEIPEGQKICGQIFMVGADNPDKYDIRWSTLPLVSKANLQPTKFNSLFGWRFTIGPEDCLQTDTVVRPLNIWVKAHDTKKDYFRFVFKVTYDSDPTTHNTQLLLKTVKSSGGYGGGQVSDSGNWKKVADNFAAQNQFNQGVAAKVNNLDQRVGNLEGWATSASRPPTGQIVTESRIDYRFRVSVGGQEFSGKIWLRTYSQKTPQGRVDTCMGPWIPLNGALPGCYRVDCSYDGSSWKSLEYTVTASGQIVELAF